MVDQRGSKTQTIASPSGNGLSTGQSRLISRRPALLCSSSIERRVPDLRFEHWGRITISVSERSLSPIADHQRLLRVFLAEKRGKVRTDDIQGIVTTGTSHE